MQWQLIVAMLGALGVQRAIRGVPAASTSALCALVRWKGMHPLLLTHLRLWMSMDMMRIMRAVRSMAKEQRRTSLWSPCRRGQMQVQPVPMQCSRAPSHEMASARHALWMGIGLRSPRPPEPGCGSASLAAASWAARWSVSASSSCASGAHWGTHSCLSSRLGPACPPCRRRRATSEG